MIIKDQKNLDNDEDLNQNQELTQNREEGAKEQINQFNKLIKKMVYENDPSKTL